MTEEMKRVQERFKGNQDVKILSFTVDPEQDDVAVMKAYAENHNAVAGQWHFLTGPKEDLYSLARNSFFVLKPAEAKKDRKSTRLNSSHVRISYAVFCLKKKT